MADIFLLPTYYDIYGMVLLEAMYYGISIITSDCGGAEMMIDSEKNGMVINSFDEKEWGECIIKLLANSQLRKKIGKNATKKIIEEYTWDKLGEKFISVYQNIIETNNKIR